MLGMEQPTSYLLDVLNLAASLASQAERLQRDLALANKRIQELETQRHASPPKPATDTPLPKIDSALVKDRPLSGLGARIAKEAQRYDMDPLYGQVHPRLMPGISGIAASVPSSPRPHSVATSIILAELARQAQHD